MSATYSFLFFAFLSLFVLRNYFERRRRPRFPPGPPGLPIIGNILDLPKGQEWLAYQKWGIAYGELYTIYSSHVEFLSSC